MGLSQNIASLRKNIGLTQEKLAEKCEVSRQSVTKWESGESEPSIDKLIVLSRIFGISIDELIKNEKSSELRPINNGEEFDYSITKLCINELYHDEMFNAFNGGVVKYELLSRLVEQVKYKFINIAGNVRDKYLVCNTSEEERSTCLYPFTCGNKDTMESRIADEYVKGNCEINVFFDRIQTEYMKLKDEALDIGKTKMDTTIANEVENAVQNSDNQLLSEISSDLDMLKNYVWNKI